MSLALDDGTQLEGFVANLGERDLELWDKGSVNVRRVPTERVRQVRFSGRDTADGRSYQTWLDRQAQQEAPGLT